MYFDTGRKIDYIYENPIDNFIIYIAEILNTYIFFPLKFTPNMITTLSLIIGLLSIIYFYKNNNILAIILFIIAYILDCADGNYARKYNMVTKFGDWYDHISDIIKIIGIYIIIIIYKPISISHKIFILLGFLILFILMNIHLGCQEKLYNKDESYTLNYTKNLCLNIDYIKLTKYFGCGSLILYTIIIILSIKFFRNS